MVFVRSYRRGKKGVGLYLVRGHWRRSPGRKKIVLPNRYLENLLHIKNGAHWSQFVKSDDTDFPSYNEMLEHPGNYPNRRIEIREIYPIDYMAFCAIIQGTDQARQYKNIEKHLVDEYMYRALQDETKMPLPLLDFVGKEQDGRNRVAALKKMGFKKVPVLFITSK